MISLRDVAYGCWCFSMFSTHMRILFCIREEFLYTKVYLTNTELKQFITPSISTLYNFSKLSCVSAKHEQLLRTEYRPPPGSRNPLSADTSIASVHRAT